MPSIRDADGSRRTLRAAVDQKHECNREAWQDSVHRGFRKFHFGSFPIAAGIPKEAIEGKMKTPEWHFWVSTLEQEKGKARKGKSFWEDSGMDFARWFDFSSCQLFEVEEKRLSNTTALFLPRQRHRSRHQQVRPNTDSLHHKEIHGNAPSP